MQLPTAVEVVVRVAHPQVLAAQVAVELEMELLVQQIRVAVAVEATLAVEVARQVVTAGQESSSSHTQQVQ